MGVDAGLYLTALSTRFAIARSVMCGRAGTVPSPSSTNSIVRPLRRRVRATTDAARSARSTATTGSSLDRSVTSSTSSFMRWVSSSTSVRTVASTSGRSSTASSSNRSSSSRLVVRLVRGVRISWPASVTSRCCSARDDASASTMVVKLTARSRISPDPSTVTGVVRSWLAAMRWAVSRRCTTGRTSRPATSHPMRPAANPTTNAEQHEPPSQCTEDVGDLGLRSGHLQHATLVEHVGGDSERGALDLDGVEQHLVARRRRHGHREHRTARQTDGDRPVGSNDLCCGSRSQDSVRRTADLVDRAAHPAP